MCIVPLCCQYSLYCVLGFRDLLYLLVASLIFFFFLVRGFFLYIFDNRVSQSQHYQRCGQYSSLSWGRSCPGHGSIHGFHPPDAGTPPTPPTVTPELSPDSARWGGESQPGSNHCFGPWFTTARKPSTIS